jgi:threonine/homoserine/homoserine lactone efflux protein
MFDFSTLVTFVGVVLGLFLIPGPAVLLTLTRAAQSGRRAGVMTGVGIASGDLIHTLGTALGLSALLMTSALAFNVIKYVGAGYLIYLGVRAFLERPSDPTLPRVSSVSVGKAYLQALGTEVLNPKTALFFLAFLPQFVRPERGSSLMQFLVLGLIFVVLSITYTTVLALSVRPLLRYAGRLSWLRRWQGKIVGTIFVGLGVRVALQRQ